MLNIALPKGRLGDQVYELLASVGYDCKSIYDENRKLVFENPQTGVRYLLVKPSDVAIYVEHHAADVGIVGKDILMESNPDVYELLDLGLGKCRMCVAGKEDYVEDKDRPVRVATKFTNIAKEHYAKLGRDIDIIKLNGSIELAPILGLSDVIVDIVESGSTIRENHLKVLEEFLPISARFIANKSSFEFKNKQITEMAEKLKGAVEAHQKKKEQEKKEKEAKAAKEAAVVAKVVENATMEIPDAMVDTQVRNMADDFARRIQSQGLTVDQYFQFTGMTAEKLFEQMRPDALKRIQNSLVLEAVAKAENIEISDERVEEELQKMADAYKMELDKVKSLMDDAAIDQMKDDLAIQAAVDLVRDAAKEVEAKKEEKSEEA